MKMREYGYLAGYLRGALHKVAKVGINIRETEYDNGLIIHENMEDTNQAWVIMPDGRKIQLPVVKGARGESGLRKRLKVLSDMYLSAGRS